MSEYRGRHARPASPGLESSTNSQPSQSSSQPQQQSPQPPQPPQQPQPQSTDAPNPAASAASRFTRRGGAPKGALPGPAHAPLTLNQAKSSHFRSAHQTALESTEPRHSKRKTVAILVPLLIVLVLLGAGGIFVYTQFFSAPTVVAGQDASVVIPEGASTSEIAKILKDKNVISSESAFIKDVQNKEADASLKPGNYKLVTLMDTDKLINTLVSGPTVLEAGDKLTIAEGLTIEQTAKAVAAATGVNEQGFIAQCYSADKYLKDYPFLSGAYNNSLEGFLYPKTYTIPKNSSADYVVRTLLDQFAIETSKLNLSYATEHNLTLFDIVTIASLIEEETLANSERELVSSVIYNRLSDGMRLQIDATVVYALGPSYDGHPLLNVDLEVDSPYNTYQVYELPAGPICSPRIESIQAAAHPADTNYYYYVLTSKEGFHTFCETSDEFEAAKQVYEQLFGI